MRFRVCVCDHRFFLIIGAFTDTETWVSPCLINEVILMGRWGKAAGQRNVLCGDTTTTPSCRMGAGEQQRWREERRRGVEIEGGEEEGCRDGEEERRRGVEMEGGEEEGCRYGGSRGGGVFTLFSFSLCPALLLYSIY